MFRAHSKLIDESCSIFLQQFETNNPKTNNYGTLIQVFNRLAAAVRDDCDEYVQLETLFFLTNIYIYVLVILLFGKHTVPYLFFVQ